jgi:predicted GTPase
MTGPRKVVIVGAAGRDFHNFNTVFRGDPTHRVVAFTAAQIPNIDGRAYPALLAGEGYPNGIPIHPEEELAELIQREDIDEVVFSYSDVTYDHVMHLASLAMANGADFRLIGAKKTMLKSTVPVVSVTAARTGCGKSQVTRQLTALLKARGKRVVVVRHPMPYGDLTAQRVQRFETVEDFKTHSCTLEEIEEYEHHVQRGTIVYAGVDYEAILREAEKEADVILWDGGNNDMTFYAADVEFVVVDPLRVGHELSYFPGEVNLRRSKYVIINKVDSATVDAVAQVQLNIRKVNPDAKVILTASVVKTKDAELIEGKRVAVVEDGPTTTHGGMKYGAGVVAAKRFGATEIVDPRPYLVGTLKDTFDKYPEIGQVLPAMGYGDAQLRDLEATINAIECDVIVIGTPVDLTQYLKINKPSVRVTYGIEAVSELTLDSVMDELVSR